MSDQDDLVLRVRVKRAQVRALRVLAAQNDMRVQDILRMAITDYLITEERNRAALHPQTVGVLPIPTDGKAPA